MQAVVAISAAAPSVLPATLQAKVSLAYFALQSVLLALSFTTNSNMASHHNIQVESLTGSITKLLQIVARRWQDTADRPRDITPDVAAELFIEELMAVAGCCKTLASVNNLQVVLSSHPVPAEELLLCLLDDEQPKPVSQVSWDESPHCLVTLTCLKQANQLPVFRPTSVVASFVCVPWKMPCVCAENVLAFVMYVVCRTHSYVRFIIMLTLCYTADK